MTATIASPVSLQDGVAAMKAVFSTLLALSVSGWHCRSDECARCRRARRSDHLGTAGPSSLLMRRAVAVHDVAAIGIAHLSGECGSKVRKSLNSTHLQVE